MLACAANKSRVWLCGWRTGGVHKCCCCGARRDRLALRLWHTYGMVYEAARTMRMPQGTRVAAHTSPWRSNESSPKLNMTVDEQLPPVRTGAEGADGQGSTIIFRSGGLTLRQSHRVHGKSVVVGRAGVVGRATVGPVPPPPEHLRGSCGLRVRVRFKGLWSRVRVRGWRGSEAKSDGREANSN